MNEVRIYTFCEYVNLSPSTHIEQPNNYCDQNIQSPRRTFFFLFQAFVTSLVSIYVYPATLWTYPSLVIRSTENTSVYQFLTTSIAVSCVWRVIEPTLTTGFVRLITHPLRLLELYELHQTIPQRFQAVYSHHPLVRSSSYLLPMLGSALL